MNRIHFAPGILRLLAALAAAAHLLSFSAIAASSSLPRNEYRSGEAFLRAFAPVSAATRECIVKLNVNGETVALGTVVDAGGLVLTKASELKEGKLTCWLADARQVPAERLAKDEDEDLALVRVNASGLKTVEWDDEPVVLGQWAITPGIADTPHAVGIISALPRRINPRRAFLGVQFEPGSTVPRIRGLVPGLGAEKAGLKRGDIILAIDDSGVTNRQQVVEKVSEFREGQSVKITVQRGEQNLEVEVKLMFIEFLGDEFQELGPYGLGTEVSRRAEGFERAIEHDTVLQPWLCGGPLVNLDGKAIGLNIARASRVSTYALPAKLVREVITKLNRQQNKGGPGDVLPR